LNLLDVSFIGKEKGITKYMSDMLRERNESSLVGEREFSPPYVMRILRQFGFTDDEINSLLQ
jgi:hypothetical protein